MNFKWLSIKNIFLIGYMATGKSTIGKSLAKLLDKPMIDLDEYIESTLDKKITTIFKEEGEDYFRIMEKKMLQELLINNDQIIATGGGTPCFFDNISLMKENGIVLYLQSSPKKIIDRLENGREHRPLVKSKSNSELAKFVKKQLKERRIFYKEAHMTIRTCNSVDQISKRIVYRLKEYVS